MDHNQQRKQAFEEWFEYLQTSKRLVVCTQPFKDLLQETHDTAWELATEIAVESCMEHMPDPFCKDCDSK